MTQENFHRAFFGYRCLKTDWPGVVRAINGYWLGHHQVMKDAEKRSSKLTSHSIHRIYDKILSKFKLNDDGAFVSLRVYDDEAHWIFDVRVEPYDDGAGLTVLQLDLPVEVLDVDSGNEKVVDLITTAKQGKLYFVYPVLTPRDVWLWLFKKILDRNARPV